MTHRLVVIIVKAQSKEEAEKKAQYALDNKICDNDSYVQDSGCIVSLEHARFQDARRFIRCVDSEDVQKFLSSYCYPKDFEQRKYTESWPKEDGTLEWIDYPEGKVVYEHHNGFPEFDAKRWETDEVWRHRIWYLHLLDGCFCRDEEGRLVWPEDPRLPDKNYFAVPADVHSVG